MATHHNPRSGRKAAFITVLATQCKHISGFSGHTRATETSPIPFRTHGCNNSMVSADTTCEISEWFLPGSIFQSCFRPEQVCPKQLLLMPFCSKAMSTLAPQQTACPHLALSAPTLCSLHRTRPCRAGHLERCAGGPILDANTTPCFSFGDPKYPHSLPVPTRAPLFILKELGIFF